MLNFGLVKNPLNWLTILLMVFIAAIAMHIILTHYQLKGNN